MYDEYLIDIENVIMSFEYLPSFASRKLLLHLHKERDDLQQRLQATELARCAVQPLAL